MSNATIEVRGNILVSGSSCPVACYSGSGDSLIITLNSNCGKEFYQTTVGNPASLQISTPGAIGTSFEDIDCFDDLIAVEFFYARTEGSPLIFRFGADVARLLGSGGTFPTGFVGGETLLLTIDGASVSVSFTVGAQSAADCVNEVNAAAALVGLPTPRAQVDSSGQISIFGSLTGDQGSVVVTGGTGAATLGFGGSPSAVGAGNDLRINGQMYANFDRYPNAPERIQVSGQGSVTLLGAGRSAS